MAQRLEGQARASALARLSGWRTVLPMYAIVVLLGVVRSFNNPASRSFLPQIIPEEHLQNAVAWNSTVNQGGTILGPSLGGLIYAVAKGPAPVYTTSMLAAAGAVFLMSQIHLRAKPRPREPLTLQSVLAGLRYIGEKKIILGCIGARVSYQCGNPRHPQGSQYSEIL